MSFLNFVEAQNTYLMAVKGRSRAVRVSCFISHEELYAVEMRELRHIEAEDTVGTEEVAPSSRVSSVLLTPVGPSGFPLTRAAPSTGGRAKSNFLSVTNTRHCRMRQSDSS